MSSKSIVPICSALELLLLCVALAVMFSSELLMPRSVSHTRGRRYELRYQFAFYAPRISVVLAKQRVGTCIVTHRGPTSPKRHEPPPRISADYRCTLVSEEPLK